MRRGSEATWQGRGWPTWRMGDVSYILYNIHNIILFLELADDKKRFRVGLCSHTVFVLQDARQREERRMRAERQRSRGPESTRSLIKARA